MTKIVLGKRPKTFAPVTVTVPMPEGGTGEIGVTYKYRTRKQYGELFDGLFAEAGVKPAELPLSLPADGADIPEALAEAERFSLEEMLKGLTDKNATVIMNVLEGWDLDQPFTLPNVEQLCNELPGAALAVIERYRQACIEGRLGN